MCGGSPRRAGWVNAWSFRARGLVARHAAFSPWLSLAFILFALPATAAVLVPDARYRSGQILIGPKPGVVAADLDRFHSGQGASVLRKFSTFGGMELVRVSPDEPIPQIVARYQASGLVLFAEPDFIVRAYATMPNDPAFLEGLQWPLANRGQQDGTPGADIRAPEAWDLARSASNIIVAILDTGVRCTHEDLASNLWVNPKDGSHGYNALNGSNLPEDDSGHGTQTAGVLGAIGNNGKGVAGVAWQVQMMSCKCLDQWGSGSDSTVVASLEFALTNGARLVNASLGGMEYSQAVSNAIVSLRDAGIIVVAPCGNSAVNVDAMPRYPACYEIDNIVSVAYTTRDDTLGPTSNYGATNVDLAAPGDEIYSTHSDSDWSYYPTNNQQENLSGTSFAAAYVSGALALMLERFPTENYQLILQRLMDAVDPLPELQGKCVTGGRLNLRKALSPAMRLIPLGMEPSEASGFEVVCGPNRTCVVECSSDLISWMPVATNSTTFNRSFNFTNSVSAGAESEFYRVVSQP